MTCGKLQERWSITMTDRGGEARSLRVTRESLDALYTLDPQDAEIMENCNDEQRERMKKYINAVMEIMLTARQRQVVWMYYAEGMTVTEIAAALGISPRGARRVLGAGMRKIEKQKKIFLKMEH